MDDKTWKALEALGYRVSEDTGRSGMLRKMWRNEHPNDLEWSTNGMAREACHDSEAEAWAGCLDHLAANKEVMMSRMQMALTPTWEDSAVEVRRTEEGYWAYQCPRVLGVGAEVCNGHGKTAHDAVFALWCRVNGVPE